MTEPSPSLREIMFARPDPVVRQLVKRHGETMLAAVLSGPGSLRPEQLPPDGDWALWLVLAGRGFGKTRAGAEWIHALATERPGRFALVGATLEAARAVMVEGESGLLALVPPSVTLTWQPSLRRLRWDNGSEARLFSGGEGDALRGGQFDAGWGDEFAHWADAENALANLRMATRLGPRPRLMLTTTPLPHRWLKELLVEEGVAVTRGRTADNAANLPRGYLKRLERRYGTTLTGRQELLGEIVEDLDGALWTRSLLDGARLANRPRVGRVVVGVDPPAGGGTCGIVVAGLCEVGHAIVLDDRSVAAARPEQWARAVVAAAGDWQADRVVVEVNNGGAMVTSVLRAVDSGLPLLSVRASRGKVARAEPVASLYAAGRVFHAGDFPALEDQLCGLLLDGRYAGPGASPDRADALVWALTALLLDGPAGRPGIFFL